MITTTGYIDIKDDGLYILELQAEKYKILADSAPLFSAARRASQVTAQETRKAIAFIRHQRESLGPNVKVNRPVVV